MVGMTGEERKVADFLTTKKFRWKFQPSVSVYDLGDRQRTFYPDFYLSDLNIYIEVCGAERTEEYERRDIIYKKNEVPIIFVETYKDEGKWQHFLLRRITEIQEKRQSVISPIAPSKSVVKEVVEKPEQTTKKPTMKEILKKDVISQQSQWGIWITCLGIALILLALFISIFNIFVAILVLIVGFIVFYLGVHILAYRFSRWYKKWYKAKKEAFREWLRK
ncbi:MAG: hypothetical protein FK734_19885 [Asgard group archaeon]|nr:hypothetical protein [Asgard group archaeon]